MEHTVTLNDGVKIPQIGFGTFQIANDGSTYKAVKEALDLGYRHIDTAAAYFNEEEVGRAIKDSGLAREEIFVTSKLWLQDYGFEKASAGLDTSLRKLGLDYIDLYLLHQPYGEVAEAWRALEQGKAQGKVRSIGVSNMTVKIWQSFVPHFKTQPSVNQIEYNPYCLQKEIRKLMAQTHTTLEGWGPLGRGMGTLLHDPVIDKIAKAHDKTCAQVILRFEIQDGAIVFPKSSNLQRMKSNLEIFDFALTKEEMDAIYTLDQGHGTHDPDTPGVAQFLLDNFDVHAND